ncbi:MAG: flavodoxin family protein [Methanomassiliicoccus sp.]|nr:flavodoxin family protein [Methanomassiliicoccus sp.]
MRIEIVHASKYGNGEQVAKELQRILTAKGIQGEVHHIHEVKAQDLPKADLHVFISPTRIGKPPGSVRRYLGKVQLPSGTRYALIATHGAPQPDKKTGRMPTEEEMAKWQRTLPILDEMLKSKGLVKVADLIVFVTDLKGPLEEGWQAKVSAFADRLLQP